MKQSIDDEGNTVIILERGDAALVFEKLPERDLIHAFLTSAGKAQCCASASLRVVMLYLMSDDKEEMARLQARYGERSHDIINGGSKPPPNLARA
jgi:hypothetical protein